MMKKKNGQKGSLTVEASLAIPVFLFFVLFVWSYMPVFTAQMVVENCMSQAAQSMSVQSYGYKKLEDTFFLNSDSPLRSLMGNAETDAFQADLSAWYKSDVETQEMAKKMFIAYLAGGEASKADTILQNLEVKDGLAGLDFTGSKVTDGDLLINVKYTVNMRFMGFFGLGTDQMVINKQVCVRMWSVGDYGGVGAKGS